MPRGKKNKRSKPKRKIPLATASGFGVAIANPVQQAVQGNFVEALYSFADGLTGFRPDRPGWNPASLMQGTVPIFVGAMVSWGASKLGINNRLRDIPLVKI